MQFWTRHVARGLEIDLGLVEIVLVVLDHARQRVVRRRGAPALGDIDVRARQIQRLAGVVIPGAPVVRLVDVVRLQIDHVRRFRDRVVRALQVGQAHRPADQPDLVLGLHRERLLIELEGGLAVAGELVQLTADVGHRGRFGKALVVLVEPDSGLAAAVVLGGDQRRAAHEVSGLDETRDLLSNFREDRVRDGYADAGAIGNERRRAGRNVRTAGTSRRGARTSARRIRAVDGQGEILADRLRKRTRREPLQLVVDLRDEQKVCAAEVGRLAVRPAEIVGGHGLGDGEVAGGFERRRQFLAERLRFSERLRRVERELLLAERDQEVRLEEPGDDERPGLPHPDPGIGRAGFEKTVVAALEDERVRLSQSRNVGLLDGGARASHRQQQRCEPQATHAS